MPSVKLHPPGSVQELADPLLDPEDVATIRNWIGFEAPALEAGAEPAVILDDLRNSDPVAADRLRKAIDQFPEVGSELAGFRLLGVLGRGTFGRVYLARQDELADRFVALKVSADLAGESQTLARLQHTNIVPIYSVHRAGPFQAVCMPFLGINTLSHLLRRFRGKTAVPATGRQLVDTLKGLNDETEIATLGPRTGEAASSWPSEPKTGPGASEVLTEGVTPTAAPLPARSGTYFELLRESTYPDAVCWIGGCL